MTSATMTSFLDIFAAPVLVFERIKEKSIPAWLPFLILLILSGALFANYFLTVDMFAFMETSMRIAGQEIAQQELEQILANEQVIRTVSVVSSIAMVAIIYLLTALFFFLAAMVIAEEKLSYGQFIGLVAWGSLPTLISFISMAVTMFSAEGFVYVALLDKTSLGSLLNVGLDSGYFNAATSLSIGSLWTFVLYGIGFAILTRCKAATAIIVALVPPVVSIGLTLL